MLEDTVRKRKRTSDGLLIGTENINLILDTREYFVKFGDGNYSEYTANTIIENLHSQVDNAGLSHTLLKGIIYFKKSEEVILFTRGWTTLPSQIKKRVVPTKGWDLLVEWIDGTSSWILLKDLKESKPIDVAEFAVSRSIQNEPAFVWWVTHVMRKRNIIIKTLQSRTVKKAIKFRISVLSTIDEARAVDKANGNIFWENTLQKDPKNIIVAFQLFEHNKPIPVGSKRINYHFIFGVKFDLNHKARCVAGGHLNKYMPEQCTYASVISRDSVHIGFLLAALNGLDILAGDISNTYLNAPCREKVHVTILYDLFFWC